MEPEVCEHYVACASICNYFLDVYYKLLNIQLFFIVISS